MNKKLLKYVQSKFLLVAQDLVRNPQALKFKLEGAMEKLNKGKVKEALGTNVEDFKTLVRMVKAWLSRDYKGVPTSSIVYIVAAIVYFVTPTDFVPDFILGLGLLDDIAVLRWVMEKIKSDIEKFKKWEAEHESTKGSF